MNKLVINDIVLSCFVADSYNLGSHWIYSQEKLQQSDLNWDGLNDPLAMWHDTKGKGDFTHYGDQLSCLYEYIKSNESFDASHYSSVWKDYMKAYTGYIDGATRETLENLDKGEALPCGSSSDDLSIIGRIAPLLLVSPTEDVFVENVKLFIALTHNNAYVLEVGDFIARVLFRVGNGAPIVETMNHVSQTYSQMLQSAFYTGMTQSKNTPTTKAIESFGPACSVKGGFEGVVYCLNTYNDDFENALKENAKAGGDNSARGMIIAMIMVAAYGKAIIPSNWIEQMTNTIF